VDSATREGGSCGQPDPEEDLIMRITGHTSKTCGCRRRHTVVTTAAILIAFGGTAVALPGKSTVDSGDIKNSSVKSVDVKDNSLRSVDLADGSVAAADIASDAITGAQIATDAVRAAEIAADAVGATEIAADAVGATEIAADAVGASEIATGAVGKDEVSAFAVGTNEVDNFDLTAIDVGSDTGNASLNFPSIAVQQCSSLNIDGANDNDIGDEVIVVTPGAGFGGLFTVGAEVQNATTFAVKVCNISGAAGDPDGAGGAIYSWVMFEA
jgi:hypothetical protein